jgi:excisionase family DNA binding protein
MELITLQVAAKRLSLSTRTIRRFIENGDLAFVKIGRSIRIPLADLERFIKIHTLRNEGMA